MKKTVYKCTECGSRNVWITVWQNMNTDKIDEDTDPTIRCQDCFEQSHDSDIEEIEIDENKTAPT